MGSVTHESLDVETALTIGASRGCGRGGGGHEAAHEQRDQKRRRQRSTEVGIPHPGERRDLTNGGLGRSGSGGERRTTTRSVCVGPGSSMSASRSRPSAVDDEGEVAVSDHRPGRRPCSPGPRRSSRPLELGDRTRQVVPVG